MACQKKLRSQVFSELSTTDQAKVINQIDDPDEQVKLWENLPDDIKSDLAHKITGLFYNYATATGRIVGSGSQLPEENGLDEYLAKLSYDPPEKIQQQLALDRLTGYKIAEYIDDKKTGMAAFVFTDQNGNNPVIVFRGTQATDRNDFLTDTNPKGVGYNQFDNNRQLLASWADKYGNAVVVGHSLGGALAQRYAAKFTSTVKEVVAFNPPGIDRATVNQFVSNGGENVKVTHYIVEGDVVSLSGQAFLPGQAKLVSFPALNPLDKHMKILWDSQGIIGNPNVTQKDLSVSELSSPTFTYKNPGYVAVRAALLINPNPAFKIAGLGLTNRSTIETARTGIGGVLNEK